MPTEYLPVLILMVIAYWLGIIIVLFGTLVRPSRPYREKLVPYESGMPPVGEPRQRFRVSYYIVAMLFVVFDVEAVFLYPWALVYDQIGLFALIEMILFIAILVVGYIYAWQKKAFEF
ncbi:MAG TPA: NADH-quinone oxidoreductase subunit A [Dissulfurispiraceae bacterium]|nr:NADH-quinone oxidoreductase subunit A [Dissulfurispiraceae bacterium]